MILSRTCSINPVSYTHLDVYKRQVKEKEEKLEIFIPNGPRLGNKVIEAKQVALSLIHISRRHSGSSF